MKSISGECAADFDDAEIRAFIDAQPSELTYSDLAALCLKRFGPERAWSREKIALYWLASHPARRGGESSKILGQPDVLPFVQDRVGRLTVDEIVTACRETFGERAPSRSAIHRYWQKLRRDKMT
jgi:hypothetical protein